MKRVISIGRNRLNTVGFVDRFGLIRNYQPPCNTRRRVHRTNVFVRIRFLHRYSYAGLLEMQLRVRISDESQMRSDRFSLGLRHTHRKFNLNLFPSLFPLLIHTYKCSGITTLQANNSPSTPPCQRTFLHILDSTCPKVSMAIA